MLQKICFIFFILIFICLYLYVKIESFDNPSSSSTISSQLNSEIARVLKVSVRRITEIKYDGDISSGSLNVLFYILEPNSKEIEKNEASAIDTAILAQQLVSTGAFKVFINGLSTILYKIPVPTINNNNSYFNNTGLKEISEYANSKYTSVPNDASLTNFYKLGFDSKFNITPKLEPVTENIE
jgi:hypothetical protein